jgi:hypothetical protein
LREGANLGQARMNLGVGGDLEEGGDRGEQPALATARSPDDQTVVRTGFGRGEALDGPDDHVAHLVREQERLELGWSGAPPGDGPMAGRVQVDEILDFRGHWGLSARSTG